jgi:hypothetical protein
MSPDVQPPILERYGFTGVQHPDSLCYGPSYPSGDTTLAFLEGQTGLKANRGMIARRALELFLASHASESTPAREG